MFFKAPAREIKLRPVFSSGVLHEGSVGSPETTKPTAGGGAVGFVGYGRPSGRRRGRPFRQSREEVTLSKIP